MAKKTKQTAKSKATQGKDYKGGTKTVGTTVGNARELDAEQVGEAKQIESTKIKDANLVTATKIDPVREVSGEKLDESKSEQFRAKQLSLAEALDKQMRGEGVSLAGIQFQQDTDRAIKQQMAFSAANRNVNRALSARQALNNQAQLSQAAAQESAKQRFAEQLAAQQQLGDVLGTGRQQDINIATANAANQQQANVVNADAFNRALLAQAQLDQNANLANQSAINTQNLNQAQLDQNANLANVQAINDFLKTQAGLNQQVKLANQSAFNQQQLTQAQINSALKQQQISAGAQVAAANAGASASRYATDAANYRFQQELAFDMDKYYQGAQEGTIDDNYAAGKDNANQLAQQGKDRNNQIASLGQAGAQNAMQNRP